MNGMSEEDKLLRNLKDAGCDDETIKRFFQLRAGGRRQEQYRLLSMHRALLLDKLHVSQQRIDCLDYLFLVNPCEMTDEECADIFDKSYR